MIDVVTLATPELGDRSYLVHDGVAGAVVDPQRDVDRVLAAAAAAGVRIACVAETHVHNDYVSGGWALARELDVPYLVAAAEPVAFERHPVAHGDEIPVGEHFSLRVVATPGHTPHHVSYVALDRGRPAVACTGGSLLFGSVGRTDLLGGDQAASLARLQYRSVHELGQLPGWVSVLPTHGFGSFCSVGAASVEGSTIEQERTGNLAFRAGSEEAFVADLLAGFGAYPRYYHRMAPRNREGAPRPDLAPPRALGWDEVHRLAAGEAWVVDLRPRVAFAGRYLARSLNFEHDLPFTTYLGWLLPDAVPLVLAAERAEAVDAAQVDLARIGVEDLAGRYVGTLPPVDGGAVRSHPVRGFADLALVAGDATQVAVDVRRQEEWEAGHLDGAVHLPLHELPGRMDELPPGRLWVHCAAGYRAAVAASLLARHGRDVVLVDDRYAAAA